MSTANGKATRRRPPENGLKGLVLALRSVGDAASRSTTPGGDIRLHVIACRAHHLAGYLVTKLDIELGAQGEADGEPELASAVQALRHEVLAVASGQPGVRPILVQARGLALLADAVRR